MFSILPSPKPSHSYQYTPQYPSPLSSSPLAVSPLSPRDANVPSSKPYANHDKLMTSPTPNSKNSKQIPTNTWKTPVTNGGPITPPPSRHESAFSQRATKHNPLLHGREDRSGGRETRRKLFLKKVREDSEERRWKNRGGDEEIMRMLWMADENRLKERRQRELMELANGDVEELNWDDVMADEVALQEEQELEALLRGMHDENASHLEYDQSQLSDRFSNAQDQYLNLHKSQDQSPAPANTAYGSDDEDYDSLFMHIIKEENRTANEQTQKEHVDQDIMDLS